MKHITQKVTVIIPCFNEAGGIGEVITRFPRERMLQHGYTLEILVVDNNSSDNTSEVARASGARVIHEPKKGKGNAMRAGFAGLSPDTDFVVMLDGDVTYCPEEIIRMLEPLQSEFCNVVIGSRLGGRITGGSMEKLNRIGNWGYSFLVRAAYRVNVTDVLTGYFAWKKDVIDRLAPHLTSPGFAIEMEMITKMAKLGEEIYSVPITYHTRVGESNLHPLRDGYRILCMYAKSLFWKPAHLRKTRMVFVSDAVMPYHQGGKEKRLYEISRRLVTPERDVHIYTMKWWEGNKRTVIHDGVYFHALSGYYPLYKNGRRSIFQAIMFGLATLKLLFVRFDTIDVDHIPFFPLLSARLVTWLRGKKLYATWHEVWGKEYWNSYLKGTAGWIGNITERVSLHAPDVIISNSVHTTNRLLSAGVKKSIETVPLGVDLERIYSATPLGGESDVIFVGRLLMHKNVDLLVKAISIVRNVHPNIICKIIGDGPERGAVERQIISLDLQSNIDLIGRVVNMDDLYGFMKSSKMLVLPSVREGFGLVVVEANAAGIPVITTTHKDNAAKDLIEEGYNGFLVEPNEHDIAEKIMRVLETRNNMKPAHKIDKYDWVSVTKRIEHVFT